MPSEDQTVNERKEAPVPARPGAVQTHRRGRFPWLIVLVLLAVAAIAFVVIRRRGAASSDARSGPGARGASGPVVVVVGVVEQKDVPIYLDGLGTVQAFNTVTVRSRVEGQLLKLVFREGQDVRAGDLLAQIDPDPLRTQVQQAEAKKAQDEAQLANAQLELRRDAELLAGKIVSQEVYDTQQAQVNQLAAAVKADQAAIDSANVQLRYTTITAPIDGRTGLRLVDEGNIIRSGDSNGIVVVTQLRPVSVVFTLPEQSLREIQKAQSVPSLQPDSGSAPTPDGNTSHDEMTVLAVDRDNRTVLDEGKLAVIDNEIDTSTGTIRLKATFPNQTLKLWPGQFVNARLLLQTRRGPVVPASVIQRGPEGPYAFIVKDDMSVEMRKLSVAQLDQDLALIDSGLQAGEQVVVDGQYKLQPGTKVKPAQAAAAEDTGSSSNASAQKATGRSGKKGKTAKTDGSGNKPGS